MLVNECASRFESAICKESDGIMSAAKPLLAIFAPAIVLLCGVASAQETAGRHQWTIEAEAGYVGASSYFGAWTDGGFGKLRYDENDEGFVPGRLVASYRGQLTPTFHAIAIIDYLDDAADGLGIAEAYLEWRPVPTSDVRHRWRAGAYYPPLSMENRDTAWSSPYSVSFSAINTWLGEEIRPFGLEWSIRRTIGGAGSPHELGFLASAFYGDDPAGTLLFWRGWSLHDRQTRFGDRLQIPQSPVWDNTGTVVGFRDQFVEPVDDIDGDPGFYAAVEWEYGRSALVQFAYYDNRADPYAFSNDQWAWHTKFSQVGFQLELPADFGLIGQWMQGETYWLVGIGLDGIVPSFATLEEDLFESYYLLLTRKIGDAHRVSLRYDDFDIVREENPPALHADAGSAWTLAYRYERDERFDVAVEWLEMDSARDLWSVFYGQPGRATERQLRLQLTYKLHLPRLN